MKQTAYLLFFTSLLSLMLVACGKDYTTDLAPLQAPELSTSTETTASTGYIETTAATSPVPPATITEEGAAKAGALPMMNVPTFRYYTLMENSPPLFSKKCLITANPQACSSEALKEWLNVQLKNKENGLKKGEYSIQYIVFEINKEGAVFNVEHIGSSGNTICWPCVETALQTVRNMPAWTPATQNGQPINVSLKLPVRFEVI